jgi:hypothetical protein
MRAAAALALTWVLAGCREEPEPEPPAPRPAADAVEVTAASPYATDSSAPEQARETAPRPLAPLLDSLDVGRVVYPVPSAEAFVHDGLEVRVAHDSVAGINFSSSYCGLVVLRGWLRVTCSMYLPSVLLLGGSTDGLSIETDQGSATITMPLVPGDRRVLQLAHGAGDYGASELTRGAVLSETWVGTNAPHVVVTEPVWVTTFFQGR